MYVCKYLHTKVGNTYKVNFMKYFYRRWRRTCIPWISINCKIISWHLGNWYWLKFNQSIKVDFLAFFTWKWRIFRAKSWFFFLDFSRFLDPPFLARNFSVLDFPFLDFSTRNVHPYYNQNGEKCFSLLVLVMVWFVE